MRVICIDNSFMQKLITEGNTYTVMEVFGDVYYRLEEVKYNPFTGEIAGFYKSRFIPLSEIDETEMVRESELINH